MTHARAFDRPTVYRIRIKGHLDAARSGWFGDLAITWPGADETLLVGIVADQSALHGLLARIRDLGLPLVGVQRVEPDPDPGVATYPVLPPKNTEDIDEAQHT